MLGQANLIHMQFILGFQENILLLIIAPVIIFAYSVNCIPINVFTPTYQNWTYVHLARKSLWMYSELLVHISKISQTLLVSSVQQVC